MKSIIISDAKIPHILKKNPLIKNFKANFVADWY